MINSNFIAIVDENEISQAQTLFTKIMKNHATEINLIGTIYFPGPDHAKFQIFWFKEHSFWYGYKIIGEGKTKKHRNVFGKGKYNKDTNKNYDLQCNIPISGYRKQISATFVKNDENEIFVAHNGRIGGVVDYGDESKENENKFKHTTSFPKIKDDKNRDLFLISKIDETLIQKFAKLTNEVHSIKYPFGGFDFSILNELEKKKDDLENKITQVEYYDIRKRCEEEIDQEDYSAQGSESSVYVRAKQEKFRKILLQEYSSKCAFCGFNELEYLVGAHIVPFNIMRKDDHQNAMNPANGILLCKLCDLSFERGDILLQKNFEITINEKLKKSNNAAVCSWLEKINSKIPINPNPKFRPKLEFIQKKLEQISSKV